MKLIKWLWTSLIIAATLAGCESAPSLSKQITKAVQSSTPTIILPTLAKTATLRPTSTQLPKSTLMPDKAERTIAELLKEPIDCSAPCFWGIIPGQTTVQEAQQIFSRLGLEVTSSSFEGKDITGTRYEFTSGLSIMAILTAQKDKIENIRIKISPENQKPGNARDWLAYSPEILIKRYGQPSNVDFIADWGPGPFFAMQIYFDKEDLIVQYTGTGIIPSKKGSSQVCPLTAQFDSVWLWMGDSPVYPPGKGVELIKATSLSLDEFSKLLIGDPKQACFDFNGGVFP